MAHKFDDLVMITRRVLPAVTADLLIEAGWDGEHSTYWAVSTWQVTRDLVHRGQVDIEVGWPNQIIETPAELLTFVRVDYRSPDLVSAVRHLVADKWMQLGARELIESAATIYAENPYGQKFVPALMDKVIAGDFTTVDPSPYGSAPTPPEW